MAETIKKFLDKDGVGILWSKVVEELNKKEAAGAAAAVEAKLGTVPEGSTVMAEIEKAQTAATYDDTNVRELIGANTTAITTLKGDDSNKSVRTIANEELAAQLIPSSAAEALDTLQEIANWIQSHPNDASAMNEKITALQTAVGKPAQGDTPATGLYLTDANNAAEIARIAGLVGALGTLASKNTITNAEVAENAAIAMSKIDGLTTALAGKQPTIPANTYDAYGTASGLFANVQALTADEVRAALTTETV